MKLCKIQFLHSLIHESLENVFTIASNISQLSFTELSLLAKVVKVLSFDDENYQLYGR